MLPLLCRKACRLGVYGILGNHDFIEMTPLLEAAGVRLLLNEAVRVTENGAALWQVGLDDAHFYGLHDFDKALRDVPPASRELRILLAHSPEVSARSFHLYLTGHTRGSNLLARRLAAEGERALPAPLYRRSVDVQRHGGLHVEGHRLVGRLCASTARPKS